MHPSAVKNCKRFFDSYGRFIPSAHAVSVIDIGAQNVNGSLRDVVPPQFSYLGVDFVPGNGVDVVLEDPYSLPFESESADVIMSSSVFEHSEMFWLVFLEIMRVLKPTGLFYCNAPSNGLFHRFPVDCWRFYPDAGKALVTWAQRNGMNPILLESYTSAQDGDAWNDFVAIYVKDADSVDLYPKRVTSSFEDFTNGMVHGQPGFLNFTQVSENRRKIDAIWRITTNNPRV